MIELRNVSKYYNSNGNVSLGLRNVNLSFNKGEIVAIIGESGSGKSTLLNVICGVDTYEEGEIYFNGNETSYFNQEDMDTFRRKYVSFIYQNYNIIDSYTVLENVMLPLLINGINKKDAKKKALELIKKVGLEKRINHRGTKLSGGEKQRCVIARALASDSPILACDEPTGNLDSKTGVEIINLIKEVSQDKLVLIVTHNYEQVKDIATRTITISDGEVVKDTKPNNIIEEKKEELDLDDANLKVGRKVLAYLSSLNIKNLPRKVFFSFLVLTAFCFIGFFLYALCLNSRVESEYSSNNNFLYTGREKIIVYDKNHNAIDGSKFSSYEAYPDAFYDDKTYMLYGQKTTIAGACFTKHVPYNISNVSGKKEISDNSFFVVVPTTYSIEFRESLVDKSFMTNTNLVFSICGVATSSDVNLPTIVVNDNFINQLAFLTNTKSTLLDASGNVIMSDLDSKYNVNASNVLYLPYEADVKEIVIKIGDYNYIVTNFETKVGVASSTFFEFNNSVLEDKTYELTVYTNDIKGVQRICSSNGYSYIYPAKGGNGISLSFISFVMEAIFATVIMLVLVFISFVVLSRVYQSKKNDYAIMRSMGLLKSQMSKIVRYEMVFIGFVAAIVAVIIFVVVSIFNKEYAKMLANTNFIFYIFYFAMMVIFNLLLSRRFNKKLFNFSVNKTIKEVF